MMTLARLIHTHFPQRAGLISCARMQYSNNLAQKGKQMTFASTRTMQIQPVAVSSDLTSRKYNLIYTFPPIRGLRVLSRIKLYQTGLTIVLVPTVYYLYLQGQATVMLLNRSIGIALFAAVMLYSISHFVRHVVGMMYLDSTQTVLKVSHLTFWGRRNDIFVPVSDIVTLGDSGDAKGETILLLKRYSTSKSMYFSTRLGRVVDGNAFQKVFGSLS